ncbi:MAG: PilZ domain-containing protein [Phycisphaerales bacterium]|nr:PilZ domain-containing protein [Phycisphaerales bacterium]
MPAQPAHPRHIHPHYLQFPGSPDMESADAADSKSLCGDFSPDCEPEQQRMISPDATNAAKAAEPIRANSVRLDAGRLNALLDLLDGKDGKRAHSKRKFVRWPFRQICVQLTICHTGGSKATMCVACRNLSCGGLGLLHNAYVHPGRACQVSLPHVSGHYVEVPGKVVRCSHLSGIVHEVGIQFDEPIRINDFVNLGPNAAAFSLERVDPKSLNGALLMVGGSKLDQQLVSHHLRGTAVRVNLISASGEPLLKVAADADLILLDSDFDAKLNPTVLAFLRHTGIIAPIVMIASGAAPRITAEKADAYITKPIVQTTLFQAIAEFMAMEDSKGMIVTSLPRGHPSMSLLDGFLAELSQQADTLEEAIRTRSLEVCLNICQQVAGIAPTVGFDGLAGIARQAESAASTAQEVEKAITQLRRLINCCRRAKRST